MLSKIKSIDELATAKRAGSLDILARFQMFECLGIMLTLAFELAPIVFAVKLFLIESTFDKSMNIPILGFLAFQWTRLPFFLLPAINAAFTVSLFAL